MPSWNFNVGLGTGGFPCAKTSIYWRADLGSPCVLLFSYAYKAWACSKLKTSNVNFLNAFRKPRTQPLPRETRVPETGQRGLGFLWRQKKKRTKKRKAKCLKYVRRSYTGVKGKLHRKQSKAQNKEQEWKTKNNKQESVTQLQGLWCILPQHCTFFFQEHTNIVFGFQWHSNPLFVLQK